MKKNIDEEIELIGDQSQVHKAVQNKNSKNSDQLVILTKTQDILPQFNESSYQTFSHGSDSFDSEEHKQNKQQEKPKKEEIESVSLFNSNIISQNNQNYMKEFFEMQIEQHLQLSKEQAEKIVRYIHNCFPQEKLQQLNISSDMASLQKNINSLEKMLGLENPQDIEIITMLFMLLLKIVLTEQYENAENFFEKYYEDQHLSKLYEIYDSCPLDQQQSQISQSLNQSQDEDENQYEKDDNEDEEYIPKIIEISLEKDFKESLLQKLN
ncbi:unnamed protein product [Paramecium primaurelia]|uniref:Uncharacterized protein n=1 Tax=Paramecium primaurelia TaxID=5886 RepID=A0A8S1QDZ1_PARPR|nr:unnamed protein product [Paramecium primaurelia]